MKQMLRPELISPRARTLHGLIASIDCKISDAALGITWTALGVVGVLFGVTGVVGVLFGVLFGVAGMVGVLFGVAGTLGLLGVESGAVAVPPLL
jgi:hypothetical protein